MSAEHPCNCGRAWRRDANGARLPDTCVCPVTACRGCGMVPGDGLDPMGPPGAQMPLRPDGTCTEECAEHVARAAVGDPGCAICGRTKGHDDGCPGGLPLEDDETDEEQEAADRDFRAELEDDDDQRERAVALYGYVPTREDYDEAEQLDDDGDAEHELVTRCPVAKPVEPVPAWRREHCPSCGVETKHYTINGWGGSMDEEKPKKKKSGKSAKAQVEEAVAEVKAKAGKKLREIRDSEKGWLCDKWEPADWPQSHYDALGMVPKFVVVEAAPQGYARALDWCMCDLRGPCEYIDERRNRRKCLMSTSTSLKVVWWLDGVKTECDCECHNEVAGG